MLGWLSAREGREYEISAQDIQATRTADSAHARQLQSSFKDSVNESLMLPRLLGELPGVVRVRLDASLSIRALRVAMQYQISEEEAQLILRRKDQRTSELLYASYGLRPDEDQYTACFDMQVQWAREGFAVEVNPNLVGEKVVRRTLDSLNKRLANKEGI